MTITLDGLEFDIEDFVGDDGLGHTEELASTTGLISGQTYPAEPRFPNRIFRALLNQLAADNATTSTTSHNISTGSKTFTLASPILNVGEFCIIASTADVTKYLYAQVTSKTGDDATVNVISTNGSGTGITSWSVLGGAGIRGAAGSNGADGADGFGVPTPQANKYGAIPVQNNADDNYEQLAQGTDGQVLKSSGADALPVWTTPVYQESCEIPSNASGSTTIGNGDYVIGYSNLAKTLTKAALLSKAGTANITLYLSPNRTSASGTAITGGAFTVSTAVDENSLTANNTITAGTGQYLVAKVESAAALEAVAVELSYTKKVGE